MPKQFLSVVHDPAKEICMYIVYTSKHIIKSIDSVYRTACEIGRMADPDLKIYSELPIPEWAAGMDFIPDCRVHWKQFKNLFSSEISEEPCRILWKFAGDSCIQRSILRFLPRSINEETVLPDSAVITRSSLRPFAKRRNWSFVPAVSRAAGYLPVPRQISHQRLLPCRVRGVQKIVLFARTFAFSAAAAMKSD